LEIKIIFEVFVHVRSSS